MPLQNNTKSMTNGKVAVKYTTFPTDFTPFMMQQNTIAQEKALPQKTGHTTDPISPISLDISKILLLKYKMIEFEIFHTKMLAFLKSTDFLSDLHIFSEVYTYIYHMKPFSLNNENIKVKYYKRGTFIPLFHDKAHDPLVQATSKRKCTYFIVKKEFPQIREC